MDAAAPRLITYLAVAELIVFVAAVKVAGWAEEVLVDDVDPEIDCELLPVLNATV